MIEDSIVKHKKEIELFLKKYDSKINKIYEQFKTLYDIITNVQDSFSGSWVGFHANMYFDDFKKPPLNLRFDSEWGLMRGIPRYWKEKSIEDIEQFVYEESGRINYEKLIEKLEPYFKKVSEIKTSFIIDLSVLEIIPGFETEYKKLKVLEEELEYPLKYHIIQLTPKNHMTRDSVAIQEGLKIPPHIQYMAKIMQQMLKIKNILSFMQKGNELIRRIEVKKQQIPLKSLSTGDSLPREMIEQRDKAIKNRKDLLKFVYDKTKKDPNFIFEAPILNRSLPGFEEIIPDLQDYTTTCKYLWDAGYFKEPRIRPNNLEITSKGKDEVEQGFPTLNPKAAPRAIDNNAEDKYSAEVSAEKIKERINRLLSNGAPTPLKKKYVVNHFGGLVWNWSESNAIDFDAGFDYLVRCRAIQFEDDISFNITDFFQDMTKKFKAPPLLELQIKKQLENEAENMHNSYHWLYIFENTMRDFIYEALVEHKANDWYNELSQQIKRKIEANKNRWQGGLKPRNKLEFTELPSLSNIIQNEWNTIFEEKISNINQADLTASLNKIESFRNSIAHSRMFTEAESLEFFSEIQRILKAISE